MLWRFFQSSGTWNARPWTKISNLSMSNIPRPPVYVRPKFMWQGPYRRTEWCSIWFPSWRCKISSLWTAWSTADLNYEMHFTNRVWYLLSCMLWLPEILDTGNFLSVFFKKITRFKIRWTKWLVSRKRTRKSSFRMYLFIFTVFWN